MSPQNDIRISVIIPSFNSGRYLAKTLASVARQDFPPHEVIVIDGGSTDETAQVVEAYGSLITTFVREPDRGQLDAVRKGYERSTGDVLYWLNADDIVMPGSFRAVNEAFKRRPGTQMVFSDDYAFNEERRQLYVGARVSNIRFWDRFLFYRHLYSECIFWRRELTARALPFDLTLRSATDVSVFMPMHYGARCQWLRKRLGAFRIVDGQASQVHHDRTNAELASIKKRVRKQIGMSEMRYKVARFLYAPVFFTGAWLYPRSNAAFRYCVRRATGDAARKRETRFFMDEWLALPDGVARALAASAPPLEPAGPNR